MKKKLLSLMLAGALAVTAFAGCGGSSDSGSSDSSSTDDSTAATSEDENTLTVWAWDESFNIPALEAAEAAYQEAHPEFKLEIVAQENSDPVRDAVTLAGQSGDYSQLPDIVLFQDHQIQQFVTLYPDAWNDMADADIDWSQFSAEKLSYSTVNDTHYGVPVDNGTAIFAYRTDILEECGYTLDDVTGVTWDKWLEIAKDVKAKTGKYLLSMDSSGNDLPYMMLQAEGVSQWKDGACQVADDETVYKIMDVLVQMLDADVLYLSSDWGDYTDNSIGGDLTAGVLNGNWIIPTIEGVEANSGKWEITTIPTLSGEEGYASNGGSSLYITSNCTKTDLAKDFLAYTFGGGDGAIATYDAALTNGGVISTFAPAGESDVYAEGVDYFNGQAIYKTIVEYGTKVPVVEQNDYHYDLRELMGNALTNAHNGSDLKAELEQAQESIAFKMEGSN